MMRERKGESARKKNALTTPTTSTKEINAEWRGSHAEQSEEDEVHPAI
jgi:hypothetical protein